VSKQKLLLADDSVTIQKVVKLTFADEGIDVDVVGDGDMAMLKFAESAPDIVLADVNMPGLNGYEVCERIKHTQGNIPVVLLVGSFEPFDAEEADRVGADGFLTKPFQSIRQLVEMVSSLLATNGGGPTSANSQETGDSGAFDASFAETKEMPVYADTAGVGNPGMDDEMIETTPAADLIEEDTIPRYSSDADLIDTAENFQADSVSPETGTDEIDAGEDLPAGETPREYEFSDAAAADLPTEEENILENGAYGGDSRPGFEILAEPGPEGPRDVPAGENDDSNLLEIPFVRSIVPALTKIGGAPPAEKVPPALTPEFIEEVTQRVMERLSSGAFRDLVKEVVPQVVREVTGEKMSE
jgi:CheY-like chemotaxis protein